MIFVQNNHLAVVLKALEKRAHTLEVLAENFCEHELD